MLCHIDCRATVFTAYRQTLQEPQTDQDDRSGHTNCVGIGQQTDRERGQPHDQDGYEEGVLAANHIPQPAEHQRAEGPHDEPCRKRQQGINQTRSGIGFGKKLLRNDGRKRSEENEVIPLEDGTR